MAIKWENIINMNHDPALGHRGHTGLRVHNMTNAQQPTASADNNGLIAYDTTNNQLECVVNGSWATLATSATQGTLDQAYDSGGAGNGRTITVDNGDVQLNLNAAGSSLLCDVAAAVTVTDALIFTTTDAAGLITDAIDCTDSGITNALNCGAAAIIGTTGNITFTNFAVTGSSGAVILQSIDRVSAGALQIGGSTATSVTITPATTIAGALTQTGAATFSAGITQSGGNVSITPSATTGTGVLLDGSTVTTGDVLRVEYDATNSAAGFGAISVTEDAVEVFVVAEDGNTTIAGTASGTAAITLTTGDLTLSSGAINVSPAASTDAINITAVAAGAALDINLAGTSNLAGGYIDIDGSTGSGPVIAVNMSSTYTGTFLALDTTNAVGASAIVLTGAGTRTTPLVSITDVPTTSAPSIDLNITPGASVQAGIDIDVAGTSGATIISINYSAASTGTSLAIDQTTAVAAQAIALTGAGTRTVALVAVTDTPSTLATFDLNVTPAAAQAGANVFDVDVAGTGNADVLSMDFSAAYVGDAINITMTNAGATGQALVIDGGQTAASVNVVDISSSSAFAGGTGRLMALTSSGNAASATDGVVLDIAETGAAQATSYAVQINSTNNESLIVDTGKSRFDEEVTFKASNRNTVFQNYVQAGGSNNAITATLTDSDGANVALTDGLVLLIDLNTLTLQAGANTLNLNAGGNVSIVSHNNVASNIGTAYAANGFIMVCYNSTSAVWVDLSQ